MVNITVKYTHTPPTPGINFKTATLVTNVFHANSSVCQCTLKKEMLKCIIIQTSLQQLGTDLDERVHGWI